MTMIVQYPTKKAFKEAVAADPRAVSVEDPSLMPSWCKYGPSFTLDTLRVGDSITVTNHPKRSWFAQVTRESELAFKVS